MSSDDDICWFHENLSREGAEKLLEQGIYLNSYFYYKKIDIIIYKNPQLISLFFSCSFFFFLENENGTFLVRESSTSAGDYVLSVLYNQKVNHYQIRKHGEEAFFSIGKQKILNISLNLV